MPELSCALSSGLWEHLQEYSKRTQQPVAHIVSKALAIGGAVSISNRLKQIHQSMDTVDLFRPITKFSAEIDSPYAVSEVIANAFRAAESGRPGAAFISALMDIMKGRADGEVLTPTVPENVGPADTNAI